MLLNIGCIKIECKNWGNIVNIEFSITFIKSYNLLATVTLTVWLSELTNSGDNLIQSIDCFIALNINTI